jgi:alpha-L-fucosidase 2
VAHRPLVNHVLASALIGMATAGARADGAGFDPLKQAGLHAVEMNKPAPDFFEGAVLGNGGMGVVVCTRPDAVVIHFGHNDVWDIRVAENHKDKLLSFDEIWSRVKRNTAEDRAWFDGYRKMARENYAQTYPRPWPCGTVLFGFDRRKAELLGHRVRIDTGICEVRFLTEGRRAALEVFADMRADRLWMRTVDDDGHPMRAPFDRVRLIPEDGMPATASSTTDTFSFRQVLPVLGDARDKDKALRTAVRVHGRIQPKLEQTGPFVACVELNHGLAKDIANQPLIPPEPGPQAVAEASTASARIWADYWRRSGVQLSDELLERTWYHNMYFLNCAVRPGATCPGLFANWSYKNIGTAWHGDYHTNYNLEQPFWVTFSSNHVEKHLPYVDLVHFLLPISQDWARNHYGLPGAFFPHSAYPVEMTMMPYPVPGLGDEVCETPWVVQSLWWHYLYTMDATFLRERAFGPIREAVLFLNAYMRRDEAHGPQWKDDKYHIYPTVVPELRGLKPDPRFCADCIVDLTLTKFVFRAYLRACKVLGLEREEAALMRDVREILDRFPPYPTAGGERGTVFVSVPAESPEQVYNTPNPLMPVFPGEDIGLDSPKEQLEIAIRTWQNQQNEGGNELVFLNLQGARLGVLDLEKFKRQIRYCLMPDGTCTDMVLQGGGRYSDETNYAFMARMGIWFENFSLPVVINECLLQSYTRQLRLFPNWPRDRDAAFQDLRAAGAFLVSAEFRHGRVEWARIKAEAGGPLRIINPWPGPVEVARGKATTVISGDTLKIETNAGETVRIRARE